jgi:hypothetical protein
MRPGKNVQDKTATDEYATVAGLQRWKSERRSRFACSSVEVSRLTISVVWSAPGDVAADVRERRRVGYP